MNKEIEIIFNDGDKDFRYSTVRLIGDHTSCLTDDDMLNPNDPEFVNKCMSSLRPIQRDKYSGVWTMEREFSKDGRGMLIKTLINGKVVSEEKESDYIKRHQQK